MSKKYFAFTVSLSDGTITPQAITEEQVDSVNRTEETMSKQSEDKYYWEIQEGKEYAATIPAKVELCAHGLPVDSLACTACWEEEADEEPCEHSDSTENGVCIDCGNEVGINGDWSEYD